MSYTSNVKVSSSLSPCFKGTVVLSNAARLSDAFSIPPGV